MRKISFFASLMTMTAIVATAPATVMAEGSADAGQAKSAVCAACHGADGNSVNPEWPSLAGQHSSYLASQITAFKDQSRQNPLMSAQAAALTDEDSQDLAAYYSQQVLASKEADAAAVNRGKAIYRGGDPDRGISACIACHGPNGLGNPLAGYPVIASQHSVYVANQLRLYASGERRSDPNQMMRSIARNMTEEDIKAVSSYVQGLR
jgi:cytochrome c553